MEVLRDYRYDCKEGGMHKRSEAELKKLIRGGETNTIELKVAAPRATEMAERLCGMANAQGGIIVIGVQDATRDIVGVPDHRIGETLDVMQKSCPTDDQAGTAFRSC
jgi:predicted HTH transcriptional regulator